MSTPLQFSCFYMCDSKGRANCLENQSHSCIASKGMGKAQRGVYMMCTASCDIRVLEINCFQNQIASSPFPKEYAPLQGPLQTSQMQFIYPKTGVWCCFRHYFLTVSLLDCSPYSFDIYSQFCASKSYGSTGANL